jgi:peptidoglycan/LPS O-acetylase OafA/YrhL
LSDSANRNVGLDLLRAIAITFVVVAHGSYFFSPISERIDLLAFGGAVGVQLFFVLSGYLIGQILIRHLQSETFSLNELKNFWIRRWLRTLPAYYFFLTLIALAYFITGDLRVELYAFYIFTQNLFVEQPPFYGITWSLSVEELFYVLFPLLLFALVKLIPASRDRLFLFLSLSIIIATLIARFVYLHLGDRPYTLEITTISLLRMDGIMIGVVGSYALRHWRVLFESKAGSYLFSLGAILFVITSMGIVEDQGNLQWTWFTQSAYFTVLSLAFLLMIPLLQKVPFDWKLAAAISFISKISYSLYLVHTGVILTLLSLLFQQTHKSIFNSIFFFFIYLFLSIGVAYLSYLFIELPALRYRDTKFPGIKPTLKVAAEMHQP